METVVLVLPGEHWIGLHRKSLGTEGARWISRRRQWQPTPVLLPGKSHGWRSLVGCSPWGFKESETTERLHFHFSLSCIGEGYGNPLQRSESDTTERLHFHFSLSCIGEGNGNPLQCSCLENPRDREPGGLPSMWLHRVGHN